MDTVKDIDLISLLLHRLTARLRVEASALIAETAGNGFVVTGPGRVTAAHFRLLDQLPPEGARASDLAAAMGVTKQALGQLAAQLADRGYVETVEDRWRAEVGAERYAVFRAVLGELSGASSRRSAP